MKRYFKLLLLTLFAMTITGAYGILGNSSVMAAQATGEPVSEDEAGYTEEEFAQWEAADKEPDPVKSGTMLIEFIKKYPESKLMANAEYSYKRILTKCNDEKKYQELETLADMWNKLKPGNRTTLALIATASDKLGHDDKCVQCLEEMYKMEPQAELALSIAGQYKNKLKNEAKYLQWMDVVLKAPEYEAKFELRYELMQLFAKKNDMAKAVEYAKATIKSADLVKDPSEDVKKTIQTIRHQANHIIGVNYYEQNKYDEAIAAFKSALKAEKYDDGYYWIGMCLWAQGQAKKDQEIIDEAIIMFAKAELMKGDVQAKAKEKVELLYKASHNGNTTGIEKRYRKAQETPDNF